MRYAVVIGAALLAGCGPRFEFAHPTRTGDAREQDRAECRFEAVRAAAGMSQGNPFTLAVDRAQSESRVYEACMVARGYRVQPVREVIIPENETPGGEPKTPERPAS